MTPDLSIDWDADIYWIGSSTDNGALARKQAAAGNGRGELGGPWAQRPQSDGARTTGAHAGEVQRAGAGVKDGGKVGEG